VGRDARNPRAKNRITLEKRVPWRDSVARKKGMDHQGSGGLLSSPWSAAKRISDGNPARRKFRARFPGDTGNYAFIDKQHTAHRALAL